MEEDGFLATQAVEEIAVLCLAAATSTQENALQYHANRVVGNNYSFALKTPPSQQSKLVRFVNLLQQQTLLNPQTGEFLEVDETALWTGLPGLSLTIAEHNIMGGIDYEQRRNFAALLAQLYEAKSEWFSMLDAIIYSQLVWRFKKENDFGRDIVQVQVQVASMWLIYAPCRIWGNIQKGLQTRKGTFELAHWERLKEVLKHSQGEYLDECTQDLIWQALSSMEKTEKEAVNGDSTKGSA
ncbi:unnamed protein product [Clonostachys rosea]|uniref:Uncharacterized protein n=1 Tax=Bionectria ochroleuca TaxID=29856 RepID=A0ABY6U2Q9_BIOOC|nr:unnamed protein product [Clonostachys rosea]